MIDQRCVLNFGDWFIRKSNMSDKEGWRGLLYLSCRDVNSRDHGILSSFFFLHSGCHNFFDLLVIF